MSPEKRETIPRNDSRLERFLDRIARARQSQYLVIAVSANAYGDFARIRRMAEQRRITLGYEPLDAGWTVTQPSR